MPGSCDKILFIISFNALIRKISPISLMDAEGLSLSKSANTSIFAAKYKGGLRKLKCQIENVPPPGLSNFLADPKSTKTDWGKTRKPRHYL